MFRIWGWNRVLPALCVNLVNMGYTSRGSARARMKHSTRVFPGRHKPSIKTFAERLKAKGKPAKQVIIAMAGKPIELVITILARNSEWPPSIIGGLPLQTQSHHLNSYEKYPRHFHHGRYHRRLRPQLSHLHHRRGCRVLCPQVGDGVIDTNRIKVGVANSHSSIL